MTLEDVPSMMSFVKLIIWGNIAHNTGGAKPRTVVICKTAHHRLRVHWRNLHLLTHFEDTPTTNRTVMCSFRFRPLITNVAADLCAVKNVQTHPALAAPSSGKREIVLGGH